MKTGIVLGIAALGAGAYFLAKRGPRSAAASQPSGLPDGVYLDTMGVMRTSDGRMWKGGMNGLGGSLTDALAQALSGQSTVKTQSQMNVDAGSGAISSVVIAGAAIVAAAYFLGGRRKPKRRGRRRK